MIDQMERMNALLDAYEQLLTEKQREILNLYYKAVSYTHLDVYKRQGHTGFPSGFLWR